MKIVLKILLLVFPFFLFYTTSLFLLESHIDKNNFLYGSIKKRERLQKIHSPKMVFVGGSSMAFGLDSKKIEEKLGYSVVNMGLHADVGLRYMLLEAEEYLKEGDVVVVGAEYEQFLDYFYGRQSLVALTFDINKDYYKKLDIKSNLQLIEPMHKYALKKASHSLLKTNTEEQVSEVYCKNAFNEYGDVITHWNKESKYIYDFPMSNTLNNDSFVFLDSFKKNMESKKITFIIIAPIIEKNQFELNKKIIQQINNKLKLDKLIYISEPSKYIFDSSLFFDTPYHLNKQGVDIRTEYIISDIEKYFNSLKN